MFYIYIYVTLERFRIPSRFQPSGIRKHGTVLWKRKQLLTDYIWYNIWKFPARERDLDPGSGSGSAKRRIHWNPTRSKVFSSIHFIALMHIKCWWSHLREMNILRLRYNCENYIAPWSTFLFLNIMFFYLSINKFINKYLRLFALFSYLLRFLFDFPLRLFSRP